MNKNDVIDLTVTGISSDGNGVGKHDDIAVFVPFSAVGDELRVRLLKVMKSAAYGKIERIVKPSPDREENDCPVFGKCGGCDFRHISYEAELKAKEGFIRDAFTRIGGLSPEFQPIIKSGDTAGYRNKARYPVGRDAGGGAVYGFYAARSHRIIPCDNCRLQPHIFKSVADFIIGYMRENKLPPYDETAHTGVIRHICVRKGHYGGQINVTVVVRRKVPELNKLSRKIAEKFPAVNGVVINVNPARGNAVLGGEEITLVGEPDITDTIRGVKITVSPRSFYQVNTPAAENLYEVIRDFAEPDNKVILDLYCGTGAIGLSLADKAKEVIGVESVESAVNNAVLSARMNSFANARFICSDAADFPREIRPDAVIIDPARKGCALKVLESAAALLPERVVMVSCNPATAARDCARLAEMGYKTVKVRGCDMFPRTRHAECAALLVRDW
ncbi:MAG: 23S rRNA (uracil(1939)-C(5))-methyltransferase RlmD [Oscillospiraceae bacterium]|jgi:23S rRNA (uracil1939-C5)-methyltransferase|nr:23S rRNA (uracil(1939)-C(5))-methyltransferase RlmD [Oscillospiraceae bacterium]